MGYPFSELEYVCVCMSTYVYMCVCVGVRINLLSTFFFRFPKYL